MTRLLARCSIILGLAVASCGPKSPDGSASETSSGAASRDTETATTAGTSSGSEAGSQTSSTDTAAETTVATAPDSDEAGTLDGPAEPEDTDDNCARLDYAEVSQACAAVGIPQPVAAHRRSGSVHGATLVFSDREPYVCSLDVPIDAIQCDCGMFTEIGQFDISEDPQLGETSVSLRLINAVSADSCDVDELELDATVELLAVTDTCIIGDVTIAGAATALRVYADRNVCQR